MARKTYVYDPTTKTMVEKGERALTSRGILVVGDLPDFVSPIDNSVVHGRRGLREHDKRHGVTNVADYKDSWAKKAAERGRYFTEGPSRGVREALIRAADSTRRS